MALLQAPLGKHKGFTLLELLVAMAIFSLISLTSFSLFDTVLNADENSQTTTKRNNELQRAFLIIERDMLQIARRSVRLNGDDPQEKYILTDGESYSSSNKTLAFIRNGWTNPGLLLPRSDVQSVAYQLNENTLERLHYNFPDAVVGEEPKSRPLITDVEEVNFEYYDGRSWKKKLPSTDKYIPLGIAIELELKDYGLIRRQFIVPGEKHDP
jgi:general secretion pathway protein J